MYTGKSYKLSEFIIWTRKCIYELIILATLPVLLYELAGLKWLTIPWPIVAMLGTATAFIVGFKNTQTYSRTMEAQQVWTLILNASRTWGAMCRDFIADKEKSKSLIYRHLAWLTCLRYRMREYRVWESTEKKHNAEYRKYYSIPEKEHSLESELDKFLSGEEQDSILNASNSCTQLMSTQSKILSDILAIEGVSLLCYMELQRMVKELFYLQGRSEQIKDSPYPRQYAIINTILVRFFCVILPYGLLKEFDKLNEAVGGIMQGHMVWLTIPFSVLICWMYTCLGQVGESTENPFEGNANDVPISQISRIIEIEMREMLGETDLPKFRKARNNIIL
jgi:putative membrane protein